MSEPVAVATGGDAPSVDEQAAGQASAAAGAAAVLASQTEQAAAVASESAAVASQAAGQVEGAQDAAAVAQQAAAEAASARDETRAMFAAQEQFYERMLARMEPAAPAGAGLPPPPEAKEPPEPDHAPARREHWINRKVGGKRR